MRLRFVLCVAPVVLFPGCTEKGKTHNPDLPDPETVARARLISPVEGQDHFLRYDNVDGMRFVPEDFVFNATLREANTRGAVPGGRRGGLAVWGGYADTRWQSDSLQMFSLGSLFSDSGEDLAFITMWPRSKQGLYLSADYVAYPYEDGQLVSEGRFVDVVIDTAVQSDDKDQERTVIAKRNGTVVSPFKNEDGKMFTFRLENVRSKNDVFECLQGRDHIALGFPVRGAAPGVVRYRAYLSAR